MFKQTTFDISLSGNINKQHVEIKGRGSVASRGVYKTTLDFNVIPEGFHPAAVGAYVASICCYMNAATRHQALNINDMGATGYRTIRRLRFEHAGEITITGEVKTVPEGKTTRGTFYGALNGNVSLPADLSGHAIYVKRIEPKQNGAELRGAGEGTLFRNEGAQGIRVEINTVHRLDALYVHAPLVRPEYRIVTESGELDHLTYKNTVHSLLDTENVIEIADMLYESAEKSGAFLKLNELEAEQA